MEFSTFISALCDKPFRIRAARFMPSSKGMLGHKSSIFGLYLWHALLIRLERAGLLNSGNFSLSPACTSSLSRNSSAITFS